MAKHYVQMTYTYEIDAPLESDIGGIIDEDNAKYVIEGVGLPNVKVTNMSLDVLDIDLTEELSEEN